MKLKDLLAGLAEIGTEVDEELSISGLALDSRQVATGDAFLAVAGNQQHGLTHVAQAIERGAAVVLYDPAKGGVVLRRKLLDDDFPAIAVEQLFEQLGIIAARFYDYPAQHLTMIGVTGTNGKTTCSQLLAQVLPDCGVIGTLGWGRFGALKPTQNTTPDGLAIQAMLAEFAAQGCSAVAMEVSSHGLQQGRVNQVPFSGAVFTNLSRDHLDYHGTMEDYLQAKLLLFRQPSLQFAVVNLDDDYAAEFIVALAPTVACWTFSTQGKAAPNAQSLIAEQIVYDTSGIQFTLRWGDVQMPAFAPVVGHFNLENVLAVLAVMLARGMPLAHAVERLRSVKPVVGRMEHYGGGNQLSVYVDYAHTPDALDKVLAGLRPHCAKRLIVVFGCGGNRDQGKRPQMREAAQRWADQVIVTDDNPRDEVPAAIVADILAGNHDAALVVIHDRAEAIRTAILNAEIGDCVVIAGKGHEDYQEINGVKYPFSDGATVGAVLNCSGASQ